MRRDYNSALFHCDRWRWLQTNVTSHMCKNIWFSRVNPGLVPTLGATRELLSIFTSPSELIHRSFCISYFSRGDWYLPWVPYDLQYIPFLTLRWGVVLFSYKLVTTGDSTWRGTEIWTLNLCPICLALLLSLLSAQSGSGGGWRGVEGEMPVSDLWTKPNKPGSYPMFSPQTLSPCLRAVYPTSDTLLQKTLASSTGLRNANLNLRAFFYRGRVRFTLSSQVLWVLRPFEAAQLDETDNTFLFRIPASCSRYHCCSYQCLQALKQTKPNIYGYKRKLDIVGD